MTVRQVASDVSGGLKGSPILLGLLVLNAMGVAAGLFFLHLLVEHNAANMQLILRSCLPPHHNDTTAPPVT